MAEWTSIKLNGKSQVIPAVCPNCMEPATLSYRYGYKGLKGWLTRTTYYQSFNYCEPCQKQAASAYGMQGWAFGGVILALVAFIALIVLGVQLTEPYRDQQTHKISDTLVAVSMIVSAILAIGIGVGFWWLVRAIKRKRHPVRPEQAVWGLASYYTGSGVLDVQSHSSYKAARREWVAELIKANPQQVDDDTYVRFTGAAKPAQTVARPFGGA